MNTQDFTQLNLEDRKKNIDFFSDIADESQIKFYYDELEDMWIQGLIGVRLYSTHEIIKRVWNIKSKNKSDESFKNLISCNITLEK
jgi:hypothetical protein